jgi:hypothetical protein
MRNYCYDSQEFKKAGEDPGKAPGAIMMLPTIQQRQRAEQTIIIPFFVPSQFALSSWLSYRLTGEQEFVQHHIAPIDERRQDSDEHQQS